MAIAQQVRQNRKRMSREEYQRLPEGPPYFDYIDGEAIELNRPTPRHQRIEGRLLHKLDSFVSEHRLGEVHHEISVELPTGDFVGPDLVFISASRLEIYDASSGVRGAPDLVVEISSPSTASYDRFKKLDKYFDSEVKWVWLVEQDSLGIEEYAWTETGYLRCGAVSAGEKFHPRLFPGLEIDLAGLMGETTPEM